MYFVERLNEGPRLQWKQTYENQTKQNERNAKEKDNIVASANLPEETSSRHLWLINYYGERTSTNTLASGYDILSLVLDGTT